MNLGEFREMLEAMASGRPFGVNFALQRSLRPVTLQKLVQTFGTDGLIDFFREVASSQPPEYETDLNPTKSSEEV